MGHGLGPAQRAMLEALHESEWLALTTAHLAGRLKLSERRTRAVARSLEARRLVVITREHTGWRGAGEYGRLVPRYSWDRGDVPAALVLKAGETWPLRRAFHSEVDLETWEAKHDIEFIRNGVPTSGLLVWLPENRRQWRAREIKRWGLTEAKALEQLGPEIGP